MPQTSKGASCLYSLIQRRDQELWSKTISGLCPLTLWLGPGLGSSDCSVRMHVTSAFVLVYYNNSPNVYICSLL